MRTLSLHQPWAWFVIHGFKPWETRCWKATCFGPLLIHSTNKVCPIGFDLYFKVRQKFGDASFLNPPPWLEMPRGCIVGNVDFYLCMNIKPKLTELEEMLGDFSPGRWFYRFKDAQGFDKPIPARGYQRFWNYKGII